MRGGKCMVFSHRLSCGFSTLCRPGEEPACHARAAGKGALELHRQRSCVPIAMAEGNERQGPAALRFAPDLIAVLPDDLLDRRHTGRDRRGIVGNRTHG